MHKHVSGKKQQYTKRVRKILSEVQQSQSDGGQKVDLTVATYAMFGMMNWIYNWYDPNGKLSVHELVINITRVFLSGFLAGTHPDELQFKPVPARHEQLSVWREPQS
jgi:hypothetical protein